MAPINPDAAASILGIRGWRASHSTPPGPSSLLRFAGARCRASCSGWSAPFDAPGKGFPLQEPNAETHQARSPAASLRRRSRRTRVSTQTDERIVANYRSLEQSQFLIFSGASCELSGETQGVPRARPGRCSGRVGQRRLGPRSHFDENKTQNSLCFRLDKRIIERLPGPQRDGCVRTGGHRLAWPGQRRGRSAYWALWCRSSFSLVWAAQCCGPWVLHRFFSHKKGGEKQCSEASREGSGWLC